MRKSISAFIVSFIFLFSCFLLSTIVISVIEGVCEDIRAVFKGHCQTVKSLICPDLRMQITLGDQQISLPGKIKNTLKTPTTSISPMAVSILRHQPHIPEFPASGSVIFSQVGG